MKDSKGYEKEQEWGAVLVELQGRLVNFVRSLLVALDEKLDKRLVRTLVLTIGAIIEIRHPGCGLVRSELGGYLLSPDQAPAGTKRAQGAPGNLLRSPQWHQAWFLQPAQSSPLCAWDELDRLVGHRHDRCADRALVE